MRTALLGLGRMGREMAVRLLDAGHELAVFNRTREKAVELAELGATVLERPADAWKHADVCITMLGGGPAVEAVALGQDGVLAAAPPGGGVFVEMSTISASESARFAAAAAKAGVDYLRAPVSGNPSVVKAGNLGIVVSGDRDALERVRPVLEAIGPNLFWVGPSEEARVMKLALNLMVAGTTQLVAEALALGQANGLERETMLNVMAGSAVGSPLVKYKTGPLVADDYSTTFSAEQMYKDMRLALDAGNEAGVPLPVTAEVQQLLQACISLGMGKLDFAVLVARLEREAGLRDTLPGEPRAGS